VKEETEGQRESGGGREGGRAGVKSQKKRSREITLSPTRMRGSYESRGGRNLDYCSPDYNITRTDRPACVTGDQIKTVLGGGAGEGRALYELPSSAYFKVINGDFYNHSTITSTGSNIARLAALVVAQFVFSLFERYFRTRNGSASALSQ